MTIQKFNISMGKTPAPKTMMDLGEVIKWIRDLNLSDKLTNTLIYKARTLPNGSLVHFVKNINLYITNLNKENNHDKSA